MYKLDKLKILSLIIIVLLIILAIYFIGKQQLFKEDMVTTDTTTSIMVQAKGHADDNKEYWILVSNPNTHEKDLKIIINDINVWNLIEVDREYYVTYISKNKGDKLLEYINSIK
jgi:hypothetical protein